MHGQACGISPISGHSRWLADVAPVWPPSFAGSHYLMLLPPALLNLAHPLFDPPQLFP